jgi:aminoglycoside phosphotransferase (APT) family kinase protein
LIVNSIDKMQANNCIHGVLNYDQLEHFCMRFNLEASNIHSNFKGWRKLVLCTNDRVFLFPRDPRGIEWLEREAMVYKIMNELDHLPVPKLIEIINDSDISYYKFVVITRLVGIPYSTLETDVSFKELTLLLSNLAKTITLWHEIPIESLPAKLNQDIKFDETRYSWEKQILNPETTIKAFDYVYNTILKYTTKYQQNLLDTLGSERTRSLWLDCLKEIVALPHVLLHADIHEDQILVDSKKSMKITGILDWETAKIDNPVWDFNFLEWGFGIWKWWDYFSEFRRMMWKTYIEQRKIQLTSLEGLDLFYTLSEFLIVLQPEKNLARLIGKDLETSIKICLKKLGSITERLKT